MSHLADGKTILSQLRQSRSFHVKRFCDPVSAALSLNFLNKAQKFLWENWFSTQYHLNYEQCETWKLRSSPRVHSLKTECLSDDDSQQRESIINLSWMRYSIFTERSTSRNNNQWANGHWYQERTIMITHEGVYLSVSLQIWHTVHPSVINVGFQIWHETSKSFEWICRYIAVQIWHIPDSCIIKLGIQTWHDTSHLLEGISRMIAWLVTDNSFWPGTPRIFTRIRSSSIVSDRSVPESTHNI
jgi:hypothetical protein